MSIAKKKKYLLTFGILSILTILYCIYAIIISYKVKNIDAVYPSVEPDIHSPWNGVPEFVLYLRLTTGERWEQEYRDVLIRTMRMFFPSERAKLVAVLDDEKKEDHEFGRMISKEWPYPKICYREPGDRSIYHNKGKSRMFWDMFYPEKCTTAPYVGFVDTDTFFSTFVTPSLLFENGKPIVIAKVGEPAYPCWEVATELFLDKKEVLQCMSTFPVMMKNEHLVELRKTLSKHHDKEFDLLFQDIPINAGDALCLCQFSIMCNYVWYYHRNEYAWHIQMVPDGDWNGKGWMKEMASLDYIKSEIKPEMKVPIPRTSIHLRYLIVNGVGFNKQAPPVEVIEGYVRESLCFSAGFDYCPESCNMYDRRLTHVNLFSFEYYQWFWDKRCIFEQKKHYKNVNRLVKYYVRHGKDVFGLKSITELCPLIEASEPYEA